MARYNPIAAIEYIWMGEDAQEIMNDKQIRRAVLRVIRSINKIPSLVCQCRARPRAYRTRRRINRGSTDTGEEEPDNSDLSNIYADAVALSVERRAKMNQ